MVGLAGFSTQQASDNQNGAKMTASADKASSAHASAQLAQTSYHSVHYTDLASDTANYQQKRMALSGTVMQDIHNDNTNGFVMAINGDQTRPVMVEYNASHMDNTNMVEGEAVTVKGYGAGTIAYHMMHGESQIPAVACHQVVSNN